MSFPSHNNKENLITTTRNVCGGRIGDQAMDLKKDISPVLYSLTNGLNSITLTTNIQEIVDSPRRGRRERH